ncbi:MAG: methyltransferase domain-containing protein [Bacteroidetes bacterium]|jgi:16S rRNA (guanine(966)-N(2))-methyltransferase RsmD|nr:methyltransferase domain-containing protein [Bacteroidota bacterium]
MRIITGTLKGRIIPAPDTGLLRPTSDRTKEGVFSTLAARRYFESTTVLDLFAGSGNLGFEALSRGSDHIQIVDQEADHIRHIEHVADTFGVSQNITTTQMPVEEYLENPRQSFDFVFADPPYDYFYMKEMIGLVLDHKLLNENGCFVLEYDKRHDFSGHPQCVSTKAYGRTIASIFINPGDDF